MANALYNSAKQLFLSGNINMVSDPIKAILVNNNYSPNISGDQYLTDVNPSENMVGSPQALVSKTVTEGVFNAATINFSNVTGDTVYYLVIYKDSGYESTSPLIALIDTATGLPVVPNGGNIQINWSLSTIFSLS